MKQAGEWRKIQGQTLPEPTNCFLITTITQQTGITSLKTDMTVCQLAFISLIF
jgi:hypothetical protein